MPTVAELQTRLDALQKSRAAGTRSVRFGDHQIDYKSDSEMAAAVADVKQQILLGSGTGLVHTVRVSSSKGFES